MINCDMRDYDFYTYGADDSYGQSALSKEVQGTIRIAIYETSQSIQDNIRYKDATYIGLTNNAAVNDTYVIDYNGAKLKVLYVNPQGRMKQVFLKNV